MLLSTQPHPFNSSPIPASVCPPTHWLPPLHLHFWSSRCRAEKDIHEVIKFLPFNLSYKTADGWNNSFRCGWVFKYLNKQQSRVVHFYLSIALTSVFKNSEYSVPWYSLPRGLLYLAFVEFFSFYLMDGLIIFIDFKNSCLLFFNYLSSCTIHVGIHLHLS